MNKLNEKEVVEFKVILEKRKESLERQVQSMKASAGPVDLNESFGRLSRTDAIQQAEVAKNSKEKNVHELELIERGLKRIERGEYGQCLECSAPIARERLNALPWAGTCRECAPSD